MSDYIKMNSKTYNKNNNKNKNYYTKNYHNMYKKKNCVNTRNCSCMKFQSYDAATFGQNVPLCSPISCLVNINCNNDNYRFLQYVNDQQNLYARMRRFPEHFPIISWVKDMNLTLQQQRAYSNFWYKQFGASQSLPVNDNFGGFFLPGSDVGFTD
jgi:hypothetical protein